MKKIQLFLLLLMAAMLPLATQAQETLTVNATGTNTSSTIPIYGLYCDHGNKTQFIVPASLIEGMENGQISQMVFYTESSDANVTWGNARFNVYLSEVGGEFFANTTFEDWATLTQVYAGELSVSNNQMTVEFDDEFLYSGGNLLVAFEQSVVPGTWDGLYWLGATQTENTALYQYASSTDNVYGSVTASKFMPKVTFTYTEGAASSCAKPATITIGDVTKNSANVTWAADEGNLWNLRYKKAADTVWTIVNNLTDTVYALTGLTPLTQYTVGVQNVCDDTIASGWRSGTFTTLLGVPFLEEFSTSSVPQGWTRFSGWSSLTSTTSGWTFGTSTTTGNAFDSHARLQIYSTGCKYRMVTPSFMMEDNVQLTFDMALTQSSGTQTPVTAGQQGDDWFAVLLWSDTDSTWTTIRRWDNTGSAYVYDNISNIKEEVTIELSSYAGQSIKLAFYGESTETGGSNYLHIDNVEVNYIPTCVRPKQLSVSNITPYSADLAWVNENDGTPAGYIVKVVRDTVETTYPTTSNPYTIQNLEPSTTYTVTAMTACSATDSSDWSREVIFTTECAAVATISETFEDYTSGLPSCWEKVGPGTVAVQTSHVHQGTKSLKFSGVANRNIVALPELETTNGMMLSFYTQPESSTTSSCGSFDVGYITDLSDTSTFYALESYNYNSAEFANSAWSSKEVILVNIPDNARLAFRHRATATNWFWFVDDVNVAVAPTCRKPIQVAAIDSTITTTSATIGWTNQNDDDPASWTIRLNGVDTTVTTNPFTFDNLNPSTVYTVKVRANCSNVDTSDWSDEATFGTACAAVATLTEDFESYTSGLPVCWEKVGAGTVAVQTSHVHAGTQSLKFSGVTGGNVVALPEIESYEGMQLRFYTQPESSSSSCGTFAVGYVTNVADATTFQALETYDLSITNYDEKIVNLSTVPANARLAFNHMATSTAWYWFVDDVNVELAPIPCAVPTNVTVDENYNVRWEGEAPRYNIMVVVGNDTVIRAPSSTHIYTIVSGLNNGDVATVYVQAVCADDDLSAWSEGVTFTYTVDGVNNYSISANIYPNPTTGNVTVESNAIGADITVYDMFGKQMMTSKVATETTELDFNGFAPGVYMVRIANNTGLTTVKVVKE